MTHKDIYTKFTIEYDKANVTSSYPSLTKYEVATILDKAYYALIAQKVTGNNIRRAPFEADIKSVEDLRPLLNQSTIDFTLSDGPVTNLADANIPEESLYLLKVILSYKGTASLEEVETFTPTDTSTLNRPELQDIPYVFILNYDISNTDSKDNYALRYTGDSDAFVYYTGTIIQSPGIGLKGPFGASIDILKNAMIQQHNLDGIASAIKCYTYPSIGQASPDDKFVLYRINYSGTTPMDGESKRSVPAKQVSHDMAEKFYSSEYNLPWVKQPVFYLEGDSVFVVFDPIKVPVLNDSTAIYIKKPNSFVENISEDDCEFECNATMAEELISLAVAFALENVESQRLNSKLSMRGFEA